MTHDTPDGSDERRLWCDTCELSVAPAPGDICPSCGEEL